MARASAPTLPTSVTETMTARTTPTRPTVVCSHTHTRSCSSTHLMTFYLVDSKQTLSRLLTLFSLTNTHTHTHSLSPTAMCVCSADIHVCLPSQFKCTNTNRCIPGIFRCNGQDNCGDGEDERDCRECPGRWQGGGWWKTGTETRFTLKSSPRFF